MKRLLLASAISSALAASPAAAVDFKTSGHINRMIRFADDGQGSDVQFVDNSSSRSRVRFVGSSDIGGGTKAGVRLEIGLASNISARVPLKTADGGDSFSGTGNDIRHSALWFGGGWGKVWLGHTSSATDGTAETDYSGTWIADSSTQVVSCSSCLVRTSGGGTAGTLGTFHSTFDGGRLDVLRYDTPRLGPATLQVSAANDSQVEVGGFVDAEVAGGKLGASAGYIKAKDRSGFDQWQASASFKFAQGTTLTGFYGSRDPSAGPDVDGYGFKVGHDWGANAVSMSFQWTEDAGVAGSDGTRFGLGYVHSLSRVGVDLYASYQHFETDVPGASLEDLDVFMLGSRVEFD